MIALEHLADGSISDRNFQTLARLVNPPVPQARVYSTAAHDAIANSATGTVLFDTEDFDEGSLHSTSADTGRLTASITGLYAVEAVVTTTATVGGRVITHIAKNGTSVARGTDMVSGSGSGGVSTLVRLAAGDYVEFQVQNQSGASITPLAGAALTYLAMARLGGYTNVGV